MDKKQQEFTKLIKDHEGILYKISRAYCDNLEDQKDLYQEIVLQVWKGYDQYKGKAKRTTWMYRVALNTALNFLRKSKRTATPVALDNTHLAYHVSNPLLEDQINELYRQIKRLNGVEKAIMLLLLEGRKYDEIASITGFSTTAISTKISRIKKKLKERIKV